MATISNQQLMLIPLGDNVLTWMTYTIIWEPGDVGSFVPSVSVRGQDPLVDDDLAPMNSIPAFFAAGPPGTSSFGLAINLVPRATLNEDVDLNLLITTLTNRDEIYARVQLTHTLRGPVASADTNIVVGSFGP